jgi:glycosyltransferase involved in cell wall biosynthesis
VRRGLARADRIVTISSWSRQRLIDRFGVRAEKISILPLVPDPFFSPGSEPRDYPEPFVLAVGAGEARKNIGFLIDAFARAFPAGDVRLVVVGTPPASRRPTPAHMTLFARVDDLQLRHLYRTAAVVAVPSLAEGFGLVAAEAQACGTPVVAANTSALPEAVGSAGLLLDPTDPLAWQNALRELVRDAGASARYRALARSRWVGASDGGAVEVLCAAFQLAIHDRA